MVSATGAAGSDVDVVIKQNVAPPSSVKTIGVNTGFKYDASKLTLKEVKLGAGYKAGGPNPNAGADGQIVYDLGTFASAKAAGEAGNLVNFSLGWLSPGNYIGSGDFEAVVVSFGVKAGATGKASVSLKSGSGESGSTASGDVNLAFWDLTTTNGDVTIGSGGGGGTPSPTATTGSGAPTPTVAAGSTPTFTPTASATPGPGTPSATPTSTPLPGEPTATPGAATATPAAAGPTATPGAPAPTAPSVPPVVTLRFDPGNVNPPPGSSFTTRLLHNSQVGVAGAQVNLSFDPRVVQITSVEPGAAYSGAGFQMGVGIDKIGQRAIDHANGAGTLLNVVALFPAGGKTLPPGETEFLRITMSTQAGATGLISPLRVGNPILVDSAGLSISGPKVAVNEGSVVVGGPGAAAVPPPSLPSGSGTGSSGGNPSPPPSAPAQALPPSTTGPDGLLKVEPVGAQAPGATFTFKVFQSAPSETMGAQVDLVFDAAGLELVKVEPGAAYKGASVAMGVAPDIGPKALAKANTTGTLPNIAVFLLPGSGTVPAGEQAFLSVTAKARGSAAAVNVVLANGILLAPDGETRSGVGLSHAQISVGSSASGGGGANPTAAPSRPAVPTAVPTSAPSSAPPPGPVAPAAAPAPAGGGASVNPVVVPTLTVIQPPTPSQAQPTAVNAIRPSTPVASTAGTSKPLNTGSSPALSIFSFDPPSQSIRPGMPFTVEVVQNVPIPTRRVRVNVQFQPEYMTLLSVAPSLQWSSAQMDLTKDRLTEANRTGTLRDVSFTLPSTVAAIPAGSAPVALLSFQATLSQEGKAQLHLGKVVSADDEGRLIVARGQAGEITVTENPGANALFAGGSGALLGFVVIGGLGTVLMQRRKIIAWWRRPTQAKEAS